MSARESAAMERARLELHDWIECSHEDDCRDVRRLLTLVGDVRAHAEAQKLRAEVAQNIAHRPRWEKAMIEAAYMIDPYEWRDGQLVRKADGKPMTNEGER